MPHTVLTRRFKMPRALFMIAAAVPLATFAQTPAARMMPDGSKDMYIGLGAANAPRYKGADERETRPAALLQVQWSNGFFVSGLSMGMHLTEEPGVEFGPLLAIEPGRSANGRQKLSGIGGIDMAGASTALAPPSVRVLRFTDIRSTPGAGAFYHYYLDESLRLTGNFLYGIGESHKGLLLNLGVQKSFAPATHHRLSLSANMTWANRRYTQEWFGVDPVASGSNVSYSASSGVRDVQLTLNWNWELSNLWLLTSQVSATRLMGSAADSPYVERRNGMGVRTGLAYRF
ncbi:MipA/OmpV family protein [Noviherbaspirillum sp. ST9]|uniref:MipA/OmpV family protein n=1 Tax=Noviherbaspirillum sp. ST9 TaxID=3401606 RepID=UPI003B587B56